MKSLALLHMPFSMGMGRAALHYKTIFKQLGYEVTCMNWYDFMHGKRNDVVTADILFAFVVPQDGLMSLLKQIIGRYETTYGMTVWETEDPPACFKEYVTMFDHMFAPSMFTISKFETPMEFLPHCCTTRPYTLKDVNTGLKRLLVTPGYKFYSISDFKDSRKNMKQLVQGFFGCTSRGCQTRS